MLPTGNVTGVLKKKYHHRVVDKEKKCIFADFLKWNAKASGKVGSESRNLLISRTVIMIG